ncbi:MAG: TonB family protein [Gemmatimonadetes bacterium]|nr:TonB family protein [Gemmatimonadota bacterium]
MAIASAMLAPALANGQRATIMPCLMAKAWDSTSVVDTLFVTLGPTRPRTIADLRRPFDGERAAVILQEIISRFSAPQPLPLPSTHDSSLPRRQGRWIRRGVRAELGFALDASAHVAARWVTDSTDAAPLADAFLSAIAATDAAGGMPPRADSVGRDDFQLRVALARGDGVSAPLVLLRQVAYIVPDDAFTPIAPIGMGQAPRYPDQLRREGVRGSVLARWEVDTLGRVVPNTFEAIQSTRYEFEEAVRTAVLATRYAPATIGGCKVQWKTEMPFTFEIR